METGDERPGPRWLVVVRQDRVRLYKSLRRSFEADPRVAVIVDRREGSRRRRELPAGENRRRKQRRELPTASESVSWEFGGARLITRPGPGSPRQ